MDKIAILIPCYNEELTIGKVVSDFRTVLPEATIYVYDNNSKDRTAVIAQAAGAIVRRERRQGKGAVMRSMFRDIDAQCYLMIDGDDTYPPECAREMVRQVLEGEADMVVGDRLSSTYFTENRRPFHNTGNVMVRGLVNFLFGSKIKDIMSGYRALSKPFVKGLPVLSRGFEIETEITIHAVDFNYLVSEIPVDYRDRPEGSQSKLKTYSDGARVMSTIFRLFREHKPLPFFSLIALIIFAAAIILFVPVLTEFFRTGLVPRLPTLIVSCILIIASLLTFFSGVILDVNVKKHRQLYEVLMNYLN